MEASVAIASFRRPEGLARLLRSLAAQQGGVPAFEVIVVDNDASGSAAPICDAFKGRLSLRYLLVPERGIARCRNSAVAASESPYIAFIDDDDEAAPGWLASLHRVAIANKADAVFGAVTFRFAEEPPAWIRQSGYRDPPAMTDGETLSWYRSRTNNAYVRRASLPDPLAPFDVGLDLVGGEDIDLFARMAARGAKLVAAGSAQVFEYREPSRMTARWLARRSFRNGGSMAHIEWRNRRGLPLMAGAALAAMRSAGLALAALPRLATSRAAALDCWLRSLESLGRAAWAIGFVYPEYRHRP
jgi:succinoglycan biosynthesis protein ExoM